MHAGPLLLDTDTLSELSRGNATVTSQARAYLAAFGRLTISTITVFERLRGYRVAIRAGKPLHAQQQAFEALVQSCLVLPFDDTAADVAATIWARSTRRAQKNLGDLLIASIAVARRVPLVTRNRRDFEAFIGASGVDLDLVDWSKGTRKLSATTRRR
jgi:predicted nucleic acid-binding protein